MERTVHNITKLIIYFSQSVLKVFFDIFLFYCKATFSGAQSKDRAGAAKFFLAIQQNTPLDLLQLQNTSKEKYTLNTYKYNEKKYIDAYKQEYRETDTFTTSLPDVTATPMDCTLAEIWLLWRWDSLFSPAIFSSFIFFEMLINLLLLKGN